MNGGSVIFKFKGDTKDITDKTKNLEGEVKGSLLSTAKLVKSSLISNAISKGMGVISNSLDGAISRLDTMNNFPKVMSNLGQSVEDSSKAIQILSNKLMGLPTTLDAGVGAVQRFTSKNNDVMKSVDIFLAVNNAILAGGASMDIQSSALEQLSQAYAKGKPDMMEWRTLQMAMPAQLNQVAQAFGMTADEMGEALREGNLSMDDFISKIMELNTTGIGEFASFEEQARNSTGGIATQMTNLKTAITRGVANVIGAFDTMMTNNNLPTFAELVSMATQKINEAFTKVVDFMKNVNLTPFINAIKGIYNAFIKLKPLIIAVTTAIITYNATMKLIKLAGIIMNVVKFAQAFLTLLPAIKSVKDAMMLLNVVFSVNPIVLIIAAIAGLVAGFIILWNKCEAFRNFWIGLWEGIKRVFASVVDFIKNNWKAILLMLVNPFAGAFKLLYDNCEGFRNFINNFVSNIKQFFIDAWQGIVSFFTETIPNFISTVIEHIKKLPYYVGYVIGYIAGLIAKVGIGLWNFFTVKIPNYLRLAWNFIKSIPSRIWEIMQLAWQKIVDFGTSIWNWITVDLPKIISSIGNWFAKLPGNIWNWLVETINIFKNWLSDMKTKAWDGMMNVFNTIVNTIKDLPSNMWNIGKNIVSGIWEGIKNAKNWLLNKVKDFCRGVVKGFKKALGIHSPSTIMFGMGVNMDKGFINGMEDMQDDIQTTFDGMFNLSPNLYGRTSTNLSPQVNVTVNNNMETDPLGQVVNNIKTFAGGSKNDYNYGQGV